MITSSVSFSFFCCAALLPAQQLLLPAEVQPPASSPKGGVDIADYDLDGNIDFAIGADLYRGDGSGSFRPSAIRPPAPFVDGPIGAFDIDLDGDLDAVYLDGLWINQGGSYVDETATRIGSTLSDGAWIELVYDVDGDGDLDLLASYFNTLPGGYTLLDLETAHNDGTGHFPTASSRYMGAGDVIDLNGLAHGDFDGDGVQDLAFSYTWFDFGGSGGSVGGAYPGSGIFKLPGSDVLAGSKFRIATDIDNDGLDDIVIPAFSGTKVMIGATTLVAINSNFGEPFAADFDDDGDVDVMTKLFGSDTFDLSLNDGAGSFVTSSFSIPSTPADPAQIEFGDVDRDGDADVVISNDPRVVRNARQQLSAPTNALLGATLDYTVHAVDSSGPLVRPRRAFGRHRRYRLAWIRHALDRCRWRCLAAHRNHCGRSGHEVADCPGQTAPRRPRAVHTSRDRRHRRQSAPFEPYADSDPVKSRWLGWGY